MPSSSLLSFEIEFRSLFSELFHSAYFFTNFISGSPSRPSVPLSAKQRGPSLPFSSARGHHNYFFALSTAPKRRGRERPRRCFPCGRHRMERGYGRQGMEGEIRPRARGGEVRRRRSGDWIGLESVGRRPSGKGGRPQGRGRKEGEKKSWIRGFWRKEK